MEKGPGDIHSLELPKATAGSCAVMHGLYSEFWPQVQCNSRRRLPETQFTSAVVFRARWRELWQRLLRQRRHGHQQAKVPPPLKPSELVTCGLGLPFPEPIRVPPIKARAGKLRTLPESGARRGNASCAYAPAANLRVSEPAASCHTRFTLFRGWNETALIE
jgi:hypothetical protein